MNSTKKLFLPASFGDFLLPTYIYLSKLAFINYLYFQLFMCLCFPLVAMHECKTDFFSHRPTSGGIQLPIREFSLGQISPTCGYVRVGGMLFQPITHVGVF